MKNIAIASYSYHGLLGSGMIDIFGYIESMRYRYGLQNADIWNGMLVSTEDSYITKIKTALEERDMTLVNLCVDGPHLWDDDKELRKNNKALALKYLKIAQILNAQTIRIDVGVRPQEITEEQLDYVASTYSEYAHIAGESGFMVGPENHWGASLFIENMEKIRNAVNNKNYGILLHVKPWPDDSENGNARAAKFAVHTHLDYDHCTGDIEGTIKMLTENGYTGCFSAEHHSGKNEYDETLFQIGGIKSALNRLFEQGITTGGYNPLLKKYGLR